MKTLFALSALVAATASAALAGIARAEYYIGADPGPGNGVLLDPIQPSGKATFDFTVPTSVIAALPNGVHWITGRIQNENGDWSVAFTRPFLKANPVQTLLRRIVAAEYYINDDPGPGNGLPVPLSGPGLATSLKIEVPPAAMAALPTGIHWITGRVQNENGDWSTAFTRPFLKYNPASAPVPLASRIEYHWRLNGAPVGTPFVLAAEVPAKVITFHFLASLRGLLDGVTYQLVATPFDHFGNQGFSETRQVKIEPPTKTATDCPIFGSSLMESPLAPTTLTATA